MDAGGAAEEFPLVCGKTAAEIEAILDDLDEHSFSKPGAEARDLIRMYIVVARPTVPINQSIT